MKNKPKRIYTPFLLLTLLLFFLAACSSSAPEASDESLDQTTSDTTELQDVAEEKKASEPITSLHELAVNQLRVLSRSSSGEGDCDSQMTRYQMQNGGQLHIDSVNCYDYGKSFYYFYLNMADELQMVQILDVSNDYNPETERAEVILSDRIIDFQGTQPKMMFRTETLERF